MVVDIAQRQRFEAAEAALREQSPYRNPAVQHADVVQLLEGRLRRRQHATLRGCRERVRVRVRVPCLGAIPRETVSPMVLAREGTLGTMSQLSDRSRREQHSTTKTGSTFCNGPQLPCIVTRPRQRPWVASAVGLKAVQRAEQCHRPPAYH